MCLHLYNILYQTYITILLGNRKSDRYVYKTKKCYHDLSNKCEIGVRIHIANIF